MPRPRPHRPGDNAGAMRQTRARPPIIVLTTDFGLSDGYVGVMHGAILTIAREATIADLSHEVPPQDVSAAAFLLECSWRYFPRDAIHVVVVDPGVGTARAILAVESPGGTFLAPDNGVLTGVLRRQSDELPIAGGRLPVSALGSSWDIREVRNSRFWLPSVSNTFHGRDIFAPVAAHLALGATLDDLGPAAESVLLMPAAVPVRQPDGSLLAQVIYIDHFGNLITDIGWEIAQSPETTLRLSIKNHVIDGLHGSYSSSSELLALIGSSGRVEIAMPNGNAAKSLGSRVGDVVEVEVIPRRL